MSATVISTEAVTLSGGSATITVPSDCTKVLVQWTYFNSSDNQGLASATLNSASPDATSELPTLGGETGTGVIEWNNPATGSRTLAMTFDAATTEGPTIFATYIKDAVSTWRDVDHDQGNGATAVSVTLTTVSGDLVIKHHQRFGTPPSATGGSWTSHATQENNGEGTRVESIVATGSTTVCDANDENYGTVSAVAYESSVSVDQDGFAFGSDDNNEATHTLNTEDTNLTAGLGVKTLRVQVDATGDPASAAYTLRYQKNGSGGYVAVPTSSSGVTRPVIEVADTTESGDNATTPSTPWAVSRPTLVSGDALVLVIAWDDSVNNTGVTVADGPNGEVWSQINSVVASSGTEVRLTAYAVKATGTWTAGSISVTPNANEQWTAAVLKIPAGEYDATTLIGASNTLASAGTTESTINCPSLTAGGSDGGGAIIFAGAADADPQSALTSGWTALSNVDRGQVSLSVNIRNADSVNSESIAAGDANTTITSDSWCSLIFIIRGVVVTNQVYVSASANVAAGGEATTARLTAPSGKTTGDFVTGRRWDDENGSDSIDITADNYSEVEWVLTTQSPAVNTDYFEFRVYAGTVALDAYSFTPKWTISSGTEYTQSASGTLTMSGALVKQPRLTKSGVVTMSGLLVRQAQKIFSGALTMSGALVASKLSYVVLTGALTMSGSLVKQAGKALSGSMTMAGTLAYQAQKALTGALTMSGSLVKQTRKSLAGVLTMSGAIAAVKIAVVTLSGTLTMSGDLLKQTGKSFSGALTMAGGLLKQAQKAFTGALTMSGVLTSVRFIVVSVSGTLTMSGDLLKQTSKTFAGTLTMAGAIAKQAQKAFTGAVTMSGVLAAVKTAVVVLSGVLTMSGALAKRTQKDLAGTLTASGDLIKRAQKAFTGALTMSGVLAASRFAVVVLTGTLTMSGALAKRVQKDLAGALGMDGSLIKMTTKAFSGVLTFAGSLSANLIAPLLVAVRIVTGVFKQKVDSRPEDNTVSGSRSSGIETDDHF